MMFKQHTLNEVTEAIFSGGTPNTRIADYWDGNHNWLSSGETSQDFIEETDKTITQLGIDKSSTKLALFGDVVMASAGQGKTRGQTSLLLTNTYINQSVIAIRANKRKINNKYLYYNLKSRYRELRAISDSASIRGSITTKMLKELPILLPSLQDQNRIADLLSSFDKKIEVNNKIIANLEEQAQAVFKSWFVDFEPFQDGDFVESELGLIPEGWTIKIIGDICSVSSGKRPLEKTDYLGYPIIGANGQTGINENYLYNEKIILMGRVGTLGVVQRYNEPIWPSDNTLVFTADHYGYLYYQLRMVDYSAFNRGSTQPLISQSDIKNIRIVFPNQEALIKFEKLASSIFDYIWKLEEQNQTLAHLRDTLLPKLMSGQIDVSDLNLNSKDDGHD